jgi:hypothetical protein
MLAIVPRYYGIEFIPSRLKTGMHAVLIVCCTLVKTINTKMKQQPIRDAQDQYFFSPEAVFILIFFFFLIQQLAIHDVLFNGPSMKCVTYLTVTVQ